MRDQRKGLTYFLRSKSSIDWTTIGSQLINDYTKTTRGSSNWGQVLQCDIPFATKISVSTCDSCVLKIDLFKTVLIPANTNPSGSVCSRRSKRSKRSSRSKPAFNGISWFNQRRHEVTKLPIPWNRGDDFHTRRGFRSF